MKVVDLRISSKQRNTLASSTKATLIERLVIYEYDQIRKTEMFPLVSPLFWKHRPVLRAKCNKFIIATLNFVAAFFCSCFSYGTPFYFISGCQTKLSHAFSKDCPTRDALIAVSTLPILFEGAYGRTMRPPEVHDNDSRCKCTLVDSTKVHHIFFSFIVASVEKVEDRIKHSLQIMLRTYFYFNLLAVVSRILR